MDEDELEFAKALGFDLRLLREDSMQVCSNVGDRSLCAAAMAARSARWLCTNRSLYAARPFSCATVAPCVAAHGDL